MLRKHKTVIRLKVAKTRYYDVIYCMSARIVALRACLEFGWKVLAHGHDAISNPALVSSGGRFASSVAEAFVKRSSTKISQPEGASCNEIGRTTYPKPTMAISIIEA